MENNPIWQNWLLPYIQHKPLLIAGPCSAETELQVMQIAEQLQGSDVSFFRAGIWKPRTRPGGFEGVGAIGLKWLQKAKEETGLKMAVEVANATHVKWALDHDIDLLWIGARTTVNPFAVQEIADTLRDTDKIVLVKNPVNPDLSLWIGGLERLEQANVRNLGAIHRGFSTYEKTKYRNLPQWQIPIELKQKFPDLPLIGDPSHISGRRDLIQEVAQQGLDLNFDGLIIESHCTPDQAWSDAPQQVTPQRLLEIWGDLKLRATETSSLDFHTDLAKFREQIDAADAKLLAVLAERMKVSEQIGQLKRDKNVKILQNERWHQILEQMLEDGIAKGLTPDFIQQLFQAIHQESIVHQERIMNR